jgi:hypothetical protein
MSVTPRSLQCNEGARRRLAATLLALTLAGLSGGCASTVAGLPPALGGLPEGTPERPEVQPAYPAVHDMPPQRTTAILTDAQLKQERDELVAAREKQLNPPPPPPRKPPPKRPARPPEDAGTARNP